MERELRYQLSSDGYRRIVRAFRSEIVGTRHLKNYYFDDPKLSLRRKRVSLRIRTIEGSRKAVVTLKYPPPKKHRTGPRALKVRYEFETTIPFRKAKAILSRKERINSLNIRPIRVLKRLVGKNRLPYITSVGSLSTIRSLLPLPFIGLVEIDRCSVFGKRFYELEVETDSAIPTDHRLRAWLTYCDLHPIPAPMSKSARFHLELEKKLKKRHK
jgi:uncharacterized protein YjbK